MDNLPPNFSNLPPPIQVTQVEKYSEKEDPPMVDLKVTNPVTYFKKWVGRFLKNQDINLHLRIKPFATIGLILAFTAVGGTAFSIGRYFFPNSSPIFHREVMYQGMVQTTNKGIFLTLPNSDQYNLKPKQNTNINFQSLQDGLALVKGNLTGEVFVIEVSEIIPLVPSTSTSLTPRSLLDQRSLGEVGGDAGPTSVLPKADKFIELPKLYSGLQWEKTQRRVLIFTSGKRKIEQEGVYLESAQESSFPQRFINYYIMQLKDQGFKETFNSIDPEGVVITYAKDDLFLTFGIKNKYSGSGDKKQISGYKAFIEHN